MKLDWDADPASIALGYRIELTRRIEREIARLHARQLRLIASIALEPCSDAPVPQLDREFVKEELRAALGESAVSVANRIEMARELVGRLPQTLHALEAGELTLRHARLLVEAVVPLDDPAATVVEHAAVPFAAGRDLAAFARKVRREALKADPRSAEDRMEAAMADRRVWARPAEDGTSVVGAVLPAAGAQALMSALEVLADRSGPEDPRTADQRRADALVQLGIDALNGYPACPGCGARMGTREGSAAPRWHGLRPTVQVTVALSTLLGIDEQPGELEGYGPVPAGLARRIAADPTGTWRRLVTDEVGRPIGYGRTRYRPPADLRDYVLARDRTCRFPTCGRRACRCEIEHVQPWADGGSTNAANLIALCCRHHHGKRDAGWQVERADDGAAVWASPAGRTYTVSAPTCPMDTTSDTYVRNDNPEDATGEGAVAPGGQGPAARTGRQSATTPTRPPTCTRETTIPRTRLASVPAPPTGTSSCTRQMTS